MHEAGLNGSLDHPFGDPNVGGPPLVTGEMHNTSSEQWLINLQQANNNNTSVEMALTDSDQARSGLHLPTLDNTQPILAPPQTPGGGGGGYIVMGGPPMNTGYGSAPMTPMTPMTPGAAYMPQVATPLPPIESPPMLEEIHKTVATQSHQLDALKARQKALIDQMVQTVLSQRAQQLQFEAQQIFGEQQKMGSVIETMLKHLQLFNQNNILSPYDLNRVYALHADLCLHLKQLEILNVELRSLFMTDVAPPYVKTSPFFQFTLFWLTNQSLSFCTRSVPALVIMRQPFPDVIAKNRQLPGDALAVKLVCGAATQLSNISPVKSVFDPPTQFSPPFERRPLTLFFRATIIADSHQGGKGAQEKPLEFEVQHLDPQTFIAQFPIKFAKGSRKCKVALRFNVQVRSTSNIFSKILSLFVCLGHANHQDWTTTCEYRITQFTSLYSYYK